VLGLKQSNGGKLDWYLDGSTFATGQDWYAASNSLNTMFTVTNVSVAASGWHVVKYVVNGRNASNTTGYRAPLTKMWFIPASD
jgi:hypothetical protein